jgi:hypothetical protein
LPLRSEGAARPHRDSVPRFGPPRNRHSSPSDRVRCNSLYVDLFWSIWTESL